MRKEMRLRPPVRGSGPEGGSSPGTPLGVAQILPSTVDRPIAEKSTLRRWCAQSMISHPNGNNKTPKINTGGSIGTEA